jgi:hypothetical protein
MADYFGNHWHMGEEAQRPEFHSRRISWAGLNLVSDYRPQLVSGGSSGTHMTGFSGLLRVDGYAGSGRLD